jgi:hypothetical protein
MRKKGYDLAEELVRGRILDALMDVLPEEKSSKRVKEPAAGEGTRRRRNSAKYTTLDLGAFAGKISSPTKSSDDQHSV